MGSPAAGRPGQKSTFYIRDEVRFGTWSCFTKAGAYFTVVNGVVKGLCVEKSLKQ